MTDPKKPAGWVDIAEDLEDAVDALPFRVFDENGDIVADLPPAPDPDITA